jgi:hypothetical protein
MGEWGAGVAVEFLHREACCFCGRARTSTLIRSLSLTTFVSGHYTIRPDAVVNIVIDSSLPHNFKVQYPQTEKERV